MVIENSKLLDENAALRSSPGTLARGALEKIVAIALAGQAPGAHRPVCKCTVCEMRHVAEGALTPSHEAGTQDDPLDNLVARFAKRLLAKLKLARANGRSGWERDDWEADCQRGLLRHLEKGDPRDVAAYCAFMDHHGWITKAPEAGTQEPVAWQDGSILPPVEKGCEREYIVAVYRARTDKVYSFACSYLNALPLNCDDCPMGNESPACKDCTDDGCPFTGWFYLTGEDGDSHQYQTLNVKDGDELRGWRETPKWEDRYAAPPSQDATREVLVAWFDLEIAAAKETQIAGFKTSTAQGQLTGEKAHARQCALYEAKQVILAALASRADRAVIVDDGAGS